MKLQPLIKVARTLNMEVKRVAKSERRTMEEVSQDLARLTRRTPRQIYNWRSGNADIPTGLLPTLCKRLGSLVLLDAIRDECGDVHVEVPDQSELTRVIAQTVRDDMRHYERAIDNFDSDGGIDAQELAELRETGARVIQNVRQIEGIAEADYERRRKPQRAQILTTS